MTNILNTASTIQCAHGGTVNITTSNTRVKVAGAYAVTVADTYAVSGCPFQVPIGTGTKPQPCTTIKWTVAAMRVKVNGVAVLTKAGVGLCNSSEQIPQGAPMIVNTQMKASAL